MKIGDENLTRLSNALSKAGVHKQRNRLRDIVDNVFSRSEIHNKRVLDVGCGPGILSFSASLLGAREVVGLEPELDGSTAGVNEQFSLVKKNLEVDNVSLRISTLQEYDFAEAPFDFVVMYNVINHLDEPACIDMHKNETSRQKYLRIFERLAKHMTTNSHLLISDCSRKNLFGDIGLKNPIVRSIEWEKHQSPNQWISVLESAGFTKQFVFWNPLFSLGILRPLFRNGIAAYLTNSHFVFGMKKAK